jgi:hypothetical protein
VIELKPNEGPAETGRRCEGGKAARDHRLSLVRLQDGQRLIIGETVAIRDRAMVDGKEIERKFHT